MSFYKGQREASLSPKQTSALEMSLASVTRESVIVRQFPPADPAPRGYLHPVPTDRLRYHTDDREAYTYPRDAAVVSSSRPALWLDKRFAEQQQQQYGVGCLPPEGARRSTVLVGSQYGDGRLPHAQKVRPPFEFFPTASAAAAATTDSALEEKCALMPALCEVVRPPPLPKLPRLEPIPEKARGIAVHAAAAADMPTSFAHDDQSGEESRDDADDLDSAGEAKAKKERPADNRPTSDCQVCGDRAIAHMHYGGICCYSCKAFFRRAVQSHKDKIYHCKQGGGCTVTLETRKACQYCRFLKCQKIGMMPSWVLSDEQCEIRFRKHKLSKDCGVDQPAVKASRMLVPEQPVQISRRELRKVGMSFSNEDSLNVEYMMCMYEASKEVINFSDENRDVWSRLFIDNRSHQYSANDVTDLINTLVKKVIFYVNSNDHFTSLTLNDKKLLLNKNMPEMCKLRGAMRFDPNSSSFRWYFSKKDQLQLCGPETKTLGQQSTLIGKQELRKFYDDSNVTAQVFSIVEKVARMKLPFEAILLLSNIVLFSSDGLCLDNQQGVEKTQQNYFKMLQSKVVGILVDLRECSDKAKTIELKR